jgi:integrase
LPRIRFHDLQHTAASLMLSAGVHPKLVQEMLGHSSVSITKDTYSHVLPSLHLRAANAVQNLLTDGSCADYVQRGNKEGKYGKMTRA